MLSILTVLLPLSVGLLFVVWPFLTALLWAVVTAVVFWPLQSLLVDKVGNRPNLAALLTFSIILVVFVLPMLFVGLLAVEEAAAVYSAIEIDQLDVKAYFVRAHSALPDGLRSIVDASGLGRFELVQSKMSSFIEGSLGLIASQAVMIGSEAVAFVVSLTLGLYVTFFLIRDGEKLGKIFISSLPMQDHVAKELCQRSLSIVRATIKGSLIVGIVQGFIGAITFWVAGLESIVLLGSLVALSSLLPIVGTGLVWIPVSIWLLASGSVWEGLFVIMSGLFLIGLVDNFLRPILVGKDTGIPDWIILVSTFGGIATMGISGIIVGPVIVGLFLAGWSILLETIQQDALSSETL